MPLGKLLYKKKYFFFCIFKVTEEGSQIRILDLDPDPLVRGTDPGIWIRILIRTKMSRIPNTEIKYAGPFYQGVE